MIPALNFSFGIPSEIKANGNLQPMNSIFESHSPPQPTSSCNIPDCRNLSTPTPVVNTTPKPIKLPTLALPPIPKPSNPTPSKSHLTISEMNSQSHPLSIASIIKQPLGIYGTPKVGICEKLRYGNTKHFENGPQVTHKENCIIYEYKDGHNVTYNKETGQTSHWIG